MSASASRDEEEMGQTLTCRANVSYEEERETMGEGEGNEFERGLDL